MVAKSPDAEIKTRWATFVSECGSGTHRTYTSALNATAARYGTGRFRLVEQFLRINITESDWPTLSAPVRMPGSKRPEPPKRLETDWKAEAMRLQRDLQRAYKQIDEHDAEQAAITRAGSLRFKPIQIKPEHHETGAPGYPMTLWSDWHWGEVVRRDETGGVNAFNRSIANKRVIGLVNNTVKLLRDYAGKNPEYPGIWVCLGGDMISGSIHEELRETNWGTVEEQALEVGDALAGGLLRMADEFGEVHVPCVVGNHGRKAHRPPAKNKVRENREYGVYKSLQRQFASDPRFTFYVPEETDFYFSVYGHRFLLTHGDSLGVKGGDGIIGALGPIARGTIKTAASERQIGRDFDTIVMGHWHQYIPRSEAVAAIVNGTLKGYDEFARLFLRARYARPSQALWLVSPKHGIAAQWPVYV